MKATTHSETPAAAIALAALAPAVTIDSCNHVDSHH